MTRTIQVSELAERVRSGEPLQLLDVRTPPEFRQLHARGALSVPLDELDPERVAHLAEGGPVYVLCKTGARASRACERLQQLSGEFVSVEGGTEAWKRAGLPVEGTPGGPISLQRQVSIAAGGLVVLFATLGHFVAPGFLLLAAGVGLGQVFAGVTDTCAMGLLLAKLPWNRA